MVWTYFRLEPLTGPHFARRPHVFTQIAHIGRRRRLILVARERAESYLFDAVAQRHIIFTVPVAILCRSVEFALTLHVGIQFKQVGFVLCVIHCPAAEERAEYVGGSA